MAEMAVRITGPPRQKEPRKRSCQMCSLRNGSWPTSQSRNSCTHSTVARSFPERPQSPQPSRPLSATTRTRVTLRSNWVEYPA